MSFCDTYPTLPERTKTRAREVLTRLLAGHAILGDEDRRLASDWAFVIEHQLLLQDYLEVAGWVLVIDTRRQIARVTHGSAEMQVRFTKFESILVVTLRLHYHRYNKDAADAPEGCTVTIGDLKEMLRDAGVAPTRLARTVMLAGLKTLRRHHLVTHERGALSGADDDVLVITPAIEAVLPSAKIDSYAALLKAYVASMSRAGDGDDAGEGDEDDPAERAALDTAPPADAHAALAHATTETTR